MVIARWHLTTSMLMKFHAIISFVDNIDKNRKRAVKSSLACMDRKLGGGGKTGRKPNLSYLSIELLRNTICRIDCPQQATLSEKRSTEVFPLGVRLEGPDLEARVMRQCRHQLAYPC